MPATATTASATVHAGAIDRASTSTIVNVPSPSIASVWPGTSKLAASGSRDSGRKRYVMNSATTPTGAFSQKM